MEQQQFTEQYRPLSPWTYFGLTILFSVPVVGFIFLLVFTFNNNNINRRNFARSYWCGALIAVCIAILIIIFGLIFGIDFNQLRTYLPY